MILSNKGLVLAAAMLLEEQENLDMQLTPISQVTTTHKPLLNILIGNPHQHQTKIANALKKYINDIETTSSVNQ